MNYRRHPVLKNGDEGAERTTLRLFLHGAMENALCAYLVTFHVEEMALPGTALSEITERDAECRRLAARCRIALDRVRDRLDGQPELAEEVIDLAYRESERADRLALLAYRLGVTLATAPVDA